MPELPEVETVARDLRGRILGATIRGLRTDWPKTIRTHEPATFAALIGNRSVESIGRRGKQLLVGLSGGLALTVHLKMTGQLFVVSAEAPLDRHVHLVFELADGRELRFRDIRKFGRVGLYRWDANGELFAEESGGAAFTTTGPEPLAESFRLADFRRGLRSRKGRLKSLLTDQAFIAGIGNIYADEALWAARLHPLRTVGTLRPRDEGRLFHSLRAVLTEAVERRGSSIDDYTAPDGDGLMQERLSVYQRAGEACPRCGRPIRRIVTGGRATHFCSWCQRLPVADRRAARGILSSARGPARRGPRWTDLALAGGGGASAAEIAATLRARAARTRRAAETRRAAARGTPGEVRGLPAKS